MPVVSSESDKKILPHKKDSYSLQTSATKEQTEKLAKKFYNPPQSNKQQIEKHHSVHDQYIDGMNLRMTRRKECPGKQYPFRKQFTMPKRLPSTNYEKIIVDEQLAEQSSLDLTDNDFTDEEMRGGRK